MGGKSKSEGRRLQTLAGLRRRRDSIAAIPGLHTRSRGYEAKLERSSLRELGFVPKGGPPAQLAQPATKAHPYLASKEPTERPTDRLPTYRPTNPAATEQLGATEQASQRLAAPLERVQLLKEDPLSEPDTDHRPARSCLRHEQTPSLRLRVPCPDVA